MSLSDLSSLGSFVSGVAVVISLFALAFQMRQNTRIFMRSESNAAQDQFSNFWLSIAKSEELTSLWIKGLRDDALNEVEEARYWSLMQVLFLGAFQMWHRNKYVVADKVSWDGAARRLALILVTKRGSVWWAQAKDAFHPEFVAALDAAIDSARTQGLKMALFKTEVSS